MLNKVIEKNMKKTYQNPTLEVVKIQTAGMLAVSGGVADGDGVGNAVKGDADYARGYDFDDEED